MAAGGSAEELFLADKANGVVRAFDVRSGQLEARDAYRLSDTAEPDAFVTAVEYSAHPETLFICTWEKALIYTVRSFERTIDATSNSSWRECNRLDVNLGLERVEGSLRALSDTTLVLGGKFEANYMHLLAVNNNRVMQTRAHVPFKRTSKHNGWDAKRAGLEIWLAVARNTEPAGIVLYRVQETALRSARVLHFESPGCPSFATTLCSCTRALLITPDGRCTCWAPKAGASHRDASSSAVPILHCPQWCVANDALVAWNLEPDNLTIYKIL